MNADRKPSSISLRFLPIRKIMNAVSAIKKKPKSLMPFIQFPNKYAGIVKKK